jgi:hypothetical protein
MARERAGSHALACGKRLGAKPHLGAPGLGAADAPCAAGAAQRAYVVER